MRYILIIIGVLIGGTLQAQFTGTDSLRNYNNRYITNNPATAFTNLRLHTLLRGMIDYIDTARAGTGGGGAVGVDTLWALNDSTVRYRKNGVFRNFVVNGVYDTRRKVDTMYRVNDTTIGFTINHTARTIIIPGRLDRFGLEDDTATTNRFFDLDGNDFEIDSAGTFVITSKAKSGSSDDNVYGKLQLLDDEVNLFVDNKFGGTRGYGFQATASLTHMMAVGHNQGSTGYAQVDTLQVLLESDPNRFEVRHDSVTLQNIENGEIDFKIRTLPQTVDTTNYKPASIGPNGQMKIMASWPGSGAPITLANVGTGYNLVATPGGNIKRLNNGYGILIDSVTSNTNTIQADTTSANHLVTLSDLNDAVAGAGGNLQTTMDLGNTTDRLYIYDSLNMASDGNATGAYVMQINPIDTTNNPPPFLIGLGATKFPGVGQRDNVIHMGWNLNSGGGQYRPGRPGGGFSLENVYIPTVGDTIDFEAHLFYITRAGLQRRLFSYTIRDGGSYDFYHTVSKLYLKNPMDERVYFNTQPSNTGASLALSLSETKNLSITYDSTAGVTMALAGAVSGGTRTLSVQGFDAAVLPTMDIGPSEITITDGTTLRSENTNTTQLGDASRRWSTVYGVDGNYSGQLYGGNVVAGNNSVTVFSGAKLNVADNVNSNIYASIENANGGTAAITSLYFAQDNNDFSGIERFNTGYSGNYPGTSLAFANSTSFATASTATGGNYYAMPFTFRTSANISLHSATGTTIGTRSDATGFRIGQINTLHTSNSYPFEVTSTSAMKLPVGLDADRPTGAAGLFRYNSTSSIIEWHNGTDWVQPSTGASVVPQIYTALLTQSGSGAPTATVLGTNDIGSIVWTRNSAGNYTGTLSSAFTANKTFLIVQQGDQSGSFLRNILSWTDANSLLLTTTDNAGTPTDGFNNMSVEIRVYP